MIAWLASYPRSGNTLLRTVLFQCLGLPSYSDEIDPVIRSRVALAEESEAIFGHREIDDDWETFYQQASSSQEVFLVKTHRMPRDDQKAIYVVRDGRRALISYLNFHRRFLEEGQRSLLELILGLDFYGGWSEHYTAWTKNRPATLVIHFEDLVRGGRAILERLANHIGQHDDLRDWENPFERLRKGNPTFFREGKPDWCGEHDWNEFADSVFFEIHGELMEALKYAEHAAVAQAVAMLPDGVRELISIIRKLHGNNREINQVCDERLKVIATLQRACDERLELIERLSEMSTK